jgi:RimJ/RimL family protein N-acetyltransferase
MRLNYETCLVGKTLTTATTTTAKAVVLVPYRPEHVERYHAWMQNEDLRVATASEPLTWDEEVAMQQSWKEDPYKCTFIILLVPTSDVESKCDDDDGFVTHHVSDMVGDVNLFLSPLEEDEDDEETNVKGDARHEDSSLGNDASQSTVSWQAEVDVMIAEPTARRQGVGAEAVILAMLYGASLSQRHPSNATEIPHISRYFAKIHTSNTASLSLFQSLGFTQCAFAECFQEYEFEMRFPTAADLWNQLRDLYRRDTLQTFRCQATD